MLKIDFGGAKNKLVLGNTWQVMDLSKDSDIVYDFSSNEIFPIKSENVDAFYTSHTLEHISYKRLGFILQEFYRTLKKGGKLRIVVPDADIAIKYYTEGIPFPDNFPSGGENNHQITRLFSFFCTFDLFRDENENKIQYDVEGENFVGKNKLKLLKSGHKSAYNFSYLEDKLKTVGFLDIKKLSWKNNSSIFEGKEDGYYSRYANYSLYIECTK
jgi:predicted SAM-dependent methyltransferase